MTFSDNWDDIGKGDGKDMGGSEKFAEDNDAVSTARYEASTTAGALKNMGSPQANRDAANAMAGALSPVRLDSVQAAEFLKSAMSEMQDRQTTYDKPEGERSMPTTVAMFNTLTGLGMSETQGWTFMAILKLVRAEYNGYRKDDYVDGASYVALAGESASKGDD